MNKKINADDASWNDIGRGIVSRDTVVFKAVVQRTYNCRLERNRSLERNGSLEDTGMGSFSAAAIRAGRVFLRSLACTANMLRVRSARRIKAICSHLTVT